MLESKKYIAENTQGEFCSAWCIAGVVSEARELRTKDGARVWAYTMKLATIGNSFDIRIEEYQFRQLSAGLRVSVAGDFEIYNGSPVLKAHALDLLDQKDQKKGAA